jgi:hypothetical protein
MLKELNLRLRRLSLQTLALFLSVPNVLELNSVLEALNALLATLCKSPPAESTTQSATTTLNAPQILVLAVSAVDLFLNQSG